MFSRVIDNISYYNLDNKNMLSEVIMKIGLERIDMQEGITAEAFLDNSVTGLVMSL